MSEHAEKAVLETCDQALRLVCAELPYLAGLARFVRVRVDPRVAVAGITESGLILVNCSVFSKTKLRDLCFVLAHELLHLALGTHQRQGESLPILVNVAHDYIINDILEQELRCEPPLGGLRRKGARNKSLEWWVGQLYHEKEDWMSWRLGGKSRSTLMAGALAAAGLMDSGGEEEEGFALDVIPLSLQRDWFPDEDMERAWQKSEEVKRLSAKTLALKVLNGDFAVKRQGRYGGSREMDMACLEGAYSTPWELALQRWFDGDLPSQRTYARPSRRGSYPGGLVRAGRSRHGWMLHILLDTSGSMIGDLPKVLGAIASFCQNVGVTQIRILQCDTSVTSDVVVSPEELHSFKVRGMGGSDMSPGLSCFAESGEVEAVLVLTDGFISYPEQQPPFRVLWVLTGRAWGRQYFRPRYGQLIRLDSSLE